MRAFWWLAFAALAVAGAGDLRAQGVLCPAEIRADAGGYYRVLRKTPAGELHGISRHRQQREAILQAFRTESQDPVDSVWVEPPRIHVECPEDWDPLEALVDSVVLRPDEISLHVQGDGSHVYHDYWRGDLIYRGSAEGAPKAWLIYVGDEPRYCVGDCDWSGAPFWVRSWPELTPELRETAYRWLRLGGS